MQHTRDVIPTPSLGATRIFSQKGEGKEEKRSGDSCSTSVCSRMHVTCDIGGYKEGVDVAILSFHWL